MSLIHKLLVWSAIGILALGIVGNGVGMVRLLDLIVRLTDVTEALHRQLLYHHRYTTPPWDLDRPPDKPCV